MNLDLYDKSLWARYKSASQRIRVLSERWFSAQMYCPSCTSTIISPHPNNYPVADFFCRDCNESYQLKSQSRMLGKKVTDGAYEPMIEAIRNDTAPNFYFLHYDIASYKIINMMLIPRYFITESIIEKRNPLKQKARRAGWVGCNILYNMLSNKGKIHVVKNGVEISRDVVRESWNRISFLKDTTTSTRGWLNDIMRCIEQIGMPDFSLDEVYAFETYLKELHPDNRNIKPKIRQQLQILRDSGCIKFLGSGRYRLV